MIVDALLILVHEPHFSAHLFLIMTRSLSTSIITLLLTIMSTAHKFRKIIIIQSVLDVRVLKFVVYPTHELICWKIAQFSDRGDQWPLEYYHLIKIPLVMFTIISTIRITIHKILLYFAHFSFFLRIMEQRILHPWIIH